MLSLNTSISGTNKSVKLLGKLNATGATKPPSTAPLPMPIGADGALTYGIIAAALSPPSFPQRFILERTKVSPIPQCVLDAAVVVSVGVDAGKRYVDLKIDVVGHADFEGRVRREQTVDAGRSADLMGKIDDIGLVLEVTCIHCIWDV